MKLMAFKYRLHNAIPHQFGQQMLGGTARDMSQAAIFRQRKAIVLFHQPEQQLLAPGDFHQFALRVPALLPDAEMDGSGQDVLILYAHISQPPAVLVLGINRLAVAFIHDGHQHAPPVHQESAHPALHLRDAVETGCGLYHITLLVRSHAGHPPIVLHPYQQTPSLRVGKGGKRLGYFPRIGYLELEILVNVLALGYAATGALLIANNFAHIFPSVSASLVTAGAVILFACAEEGFLLLRGGLYAEETLVFSAAKKGETRKKEV